MNKTVKITESELRSIIEESIRATVKENPEMLEEGFWDNLKQGAKAFAGKGDFGSQNKNNVQTRQGGGLNLGQRFNAAKTNFQMKGQYDEIKKVIAFLQDLVDKGQVSPQATVAQLIGGAINGNKMGTLTGMANNRASRGSKAMNDIYRN